MQYSIYLIKAKFLLSFFTYYLNFFTSVFFRSVSIWWKCWSKDTLGIAMFFDVLRCFSFHICALKYRPDFIKIVNNFTTFQYLKHFPCFLIFTVLKVSFIGVKYTSRIQFSLLYCISKKNHLITQKMYLQALLNWLIKFRTL